MRLRLFFFPLMLVLSVTIVIAAIIPQWEEMKTNKEQLSQKEKSLENISLKKENVEKLSAYLQGNDENVKFINEYLPANDNEENIIDGVNYLAINSGVSLNNVDVEKIKPVISEATEGVGMGVPIMGSSIPDGTIDASAMPTADAVAAAPAPQVRTIEAKINVAGLYESLVIFLDNLHRMDMYNEIDSVMISKAEQDAEESETSQDSQMLVADIVMNFGNLPQASVVNGYTNPLFEKANYDISVIETLKREVQSKIPPLEVSGQGVLNPFAL